MKNNEYSISIFKKYLKKKKLLENKIQKNSVNNIGSISRTLISSLIIVSVFFIAPIISDFAKKKKISIQKIFRTTQQIVLKNY